ncbi:MAG: HAD-IIA family hydrolase [Anaerolineae bacterium]|nr:HAD-IIA family hydrolase [Anaerolineae bacterium]
MGLSETTLKHVKVAVLDGDGVLWRGSTLLPGVPEVFDFFEQAGIPYILATNNSTQTIQAYVDKLAALGISAGPENVVTSATATADYLQATYGHDIRVHIVGEPGLHEIMLAAGYANCMTDADVVVAGMDRDLTYEKLRRATLFIRNGATFIGTNGDLTFPVPEGLAPGAGSLLAALEASSGQKPMIIGKPEPTMFEMALRRAGVAPQDAIMVGDRLETDILGAQRAGMQTALVMSGVTNEAVLQQSDIQPDGVFTHVAALLEVWRRACCAPEN